MATFTPLSALAHKKRDIDEIVWSQFKKELIGAPVAFVGAREKAAKFVAHKSKYSPINGSSSRANPSQTEDIKGADQIRGILAADSLKMRWETVFGASRGFSNFGNTCFMNSALQCLINTAPLVQLLMGLESHECPSNGGRNQAKTENSGLLRDGRKAPIRMGGQGRFCCFCELKKLVKDSYDAKGGKRSISPIAMARNLKLIGPTFRSGRQEDSHEFIRELLSKCDEEGVKHTRKFFDCFARPVARLLPGESPPPKPKPTSLYFAIFGSFVRSRVHCTRCGYNSDTFDPYLDLSIELRGHSLERSLLHFTSPEQLDLDNLYTCGACKRKIQPTKQLQIWQPPNILTIHLKRFNIFGKKVSKEIAYPETLDLTPYGTKESPFFSTASQNTKTTSSPSQTPSAHLYQLYAVLLHHGSSSRSGHYTAVVKASNGIWVDADDDSISKSSAKHALHHQHDAYILFYARKNPIDPSPSHQDAHPSHLSQANSKKLLDQMQQDFIHGDEKESRNGKNTENRRSSISSTLEQKPKPSSPRVKSTQVASSSSTAEESSENSDSENGSSSSSQSGSSSDSSSQMSVDSDSSDNDSDSSSDSEESGNLAFSRAKAAAMLAAHVKSQERKPFAMLSPSMRQSKAKEALKMLFGAQAMPEPSKPAPTGFLAPKAKKTPYDAASWKANQLYGGNMVSAWDFSATSSSPSPGPKPAKMHETGETERGSTKQGLSKDVVESTNSMDIDIVPTSASEAVGTEGELERMVLAAKAKKMENRAMGDLQLIAKQNKKRVRSAYDIDYDRGKLKKVKQKEDTTPSSSKSYKMHQEAQEDRVSGNNRFQAATESLANGGAPSRSKKETHIKGGADRVKRLQRERKHGQFGKKPKSGDQGGKPQKYFKKAFWKGHKKH